ncbi:uncharacterized protein M421DRAFT_9679 [Didymella exigua CBS 183.55]|uniref:Uncharacterized protein n=1 Tax=Didymella exigua CBS 183.55 TaxID=1150837 RepID=A0A6A5R9W1_9PLEO|nr:uncharacterized protein M421DRAFT_9679 [Didymella exigua CBS 183.55]KAF1923446.1 hypothetical protein M421DRAFT_9679 [Didymella exigua CBS 183.55]
MAKADHQNPLAATTAVEFEHELEVITWVLFSILVVCILSNLIYLLLSHDWVWSLAREDLNDYYYEYSTSLEDGDVCCICQEDFNDASNDLKELCAPILLNPCNHGVGDRCFSRWITSSDNTRFAGKMFALSDDTILGNLQVASDLFSSLYMNTFGFEGSAYSTLQSPTERDAERFGEKPFLVFTSWLLTFRLNERKRKGQAHFGHSLSRTVTRDSGGP